MCVLEAFIIIVCDRTGNQPPETMTAAAIDGFEFLGILPLLMNYFALYSLSSFLSNCCCCLQLFECTYIRRINDRLHGLQRYALGNGRDMAWRFVCRRPGRDVRVPLFRQTHDDRFDGDVEHMLPIRVPISELLLSLHDRII